MNAPHSNGWASVAAKYGIPGVIALYLTHFLVSTVNQKLDVSNQYLAELVSEMKESNELHQRVVPFATR